MSETIQPEVLQEPISVDDNASTLSVDDGAGSLTVDGTVAVTNADIATIAGAVAGTEMQVDVVAALPAGTNNIGDVDVLTVPAPLSTAGGGTEATALRVTIASDSTGVVSVDDNGGALTVDGTVGVSGTVTVDSELPAAAALADNTANPTTPIVGSALMVYDGTTWDLARSSLGDNAGATGVQQVLPMMYDGATLDRLRGDSTDGLLVNLGLNNDVTGTVTANLAAGTNNIGDVDVLTVPAPLNLTGGGVEASALRVTVASDSTGVLSVDDNGASLTIDGTVTASNAAGDVAHDGVDSGNPVKVGVKALSALPTAVATADRANAIGDLFGRQLVAHIDPAMQVWKSVNVTTTQTGSDVWSPASGKKIAVTFLSVASYGTTAARVILWFGANADTTYTAGTDQLLWAGSFAPSATVKPGMVISFPHPVYCVTADYEIHLTTDAAISLDITVYGYEF